MSESEAVDIGVLKEQVGQLRTDVNELKTSVDKQKGQYIAIQTSIILVLVALVGNLILKAL